MNKPGDRVGAIMDANDSQVRLFGYGVYEGDFEPPNGPFGMSREEWNALCARNGGKVIPFPNNPRIKLDSGKTVWGQECWWGPEERVRKMIAGKTVVMVDIDVERVKTEAMEEKE